MAKPQDKLRKYGQEGGREICRERDREGKRERERPAIPVGQCFMQQQGCGVDESLAPGKAKSLGLGERTSCLDQGRERTLNFLSHQAVTAPLHPALWTRDMILLSFPISLPPSGRRLGRKMEGPQRWSM